ncbi:MAG TPA: hypothetical protein VNM48_12965 [Chloroflexota bacterium]|nr:hypothetical protein [Chloroflexota bacterium]
MLRRSLARVLVSSAVAATVVVGGGSAALAQTPPAVTVTTLGERTITPAQLPAGTLVWRLETLPTGDAAVVATGSTGVAASYDGRNFLVTLGPPGGSTRGATKIAETGPVPAPRTAGQITLRMSSLTAPAGGVSAVHSHPGAEGYYVISGEFGARSQSGTVRVPAGRTFVGPVSGTPVQAVNTGSGDLNTLVFFALDSSQPAGSMATFADPAAAARFTVGGLGLPATGGPVGAALPAVGAAALAVVGVLMASRRRRVAPLASRS